MPMVMRAVGRVASASRSRSDEEGEGGTAFASAKGGEGGGQGQFADRDTTTECSTADGGDGGEKGDVGESDADGGEGGGEGDGGEGGATLEEVCWDGSYRTRRRKHCLIILGLLVVAVVVREYGCPEVRASHQRIANPSSFPAKPNRKQCRAQWAMCRRQTLRADGCEIGQALCVERLRNACE
eukprot:scaffold79741_cov50-Phaeocystis_antarctica.AAC.3